MASINFSNKLVTARVVYFATTPDISLSVHEALLDALRSDDSGQFKHLEIESPSLATYMRDTDSELVPGLSTKVELLSIDKSGEHLSDLSTSDIIVALLSTNSKRRRDQIDGFIQLEEQLALFELGLKDIPIVIQVEDHPDGDGTTKLNDLLYEINPYELEVVTTLSGQPKTITAAHNRTLELLFQHYQGILDNELVPLPHPAEQTADYTDEYSHHDDVGEDYHTVEIEREEPTVMPTSLIEIPFLPRELAGSHPISVDGFGIDDERVEIDITMGRVSTQSHETIRVVLLNQPADEPISPTLTTPSPRGSSSTPPVGDLIEEALTLRNLNELRISMTYSIGLTIGGALIGLLVGFLLFYG